MYWKFKEDICGSNFHRNGPTKHLFIQTLGRSWLTPRTGTLSHLEGAPAFHRAPGLPVRGTGSRQGVGLVPERYTGESSTRGSPLPPGHPGNSCARTYFTEQVCQGHTFRKKKKKKEFHSLINWGGRCLASTRLGDFCKHSSLNHSYWFYLRVSSRYSLGLLRAS